MSAPVIDRGWAGIMSRPGAPHSALLAVPSSPITVTTAEEWPIAWDRELALFQTNSGYKPSAASKPTGDSATALRTLRRLSGLTWEQLADLLGVSRRSLHFWASGKPMSAGHEERVHHLVAAMRQVDRGAADENRSLLFQDRDGVIPLDLLAEGRYDEFIDLVGRGPGRRSLNLAPLSQAAQDARRPPRPEDLVGALQDPVHLDVGRGRAARTVKAKRRGRE